MAIKMTLDEKGTNEFEFEKTKGFGTLNFVWHNTRIKLEDTNLSINHKRKLFLSSWKDMESASINYDNLDKIERKGHFSKGDLIAGIFIGIMSLVTLQLYGLLFAAFLIFFAYGKNIVIFRKDGSKMIIQNGGPLSGGGQAEFDKMIPALTTKTGRQVYVQPVKA